MGDATFSDPNREALGLPPIWTGRGEKPKASRTKASDTPPEPETPPADPTPPPSTEDTPRPTPRKRST